MRSLEAFKMGSGLIAAKLTGRSVPFHVTLYVTTRCNLRCVYCSSPDQRVEELTTPQWHRALDELHALGTRRVLFFGGEPLIRVGLADLVAHARRLGLRCALTSNGTLVPERPDVVRQLQTLTISLDGDAAEHDGNRGAGSHQDALRAIAAARAWGVPVKLSAVLNAANAGSLDWLLDFSRRERLPITLNIMRSEDNGLWKDAARYRLDADQLRALVGRIVEAKATHPWLVFSRHTYELVQRWSDFTRDRLSDAEAGAKFPGPRCSAGRFHCVIYADGTLFPCGLTVGQVDALNVKTAGVAAALERARQHGCATCFSPCMVETNSLFALRPSVVVPLAKRYVNSSELG